MFHVTFEDQVPLKKAAFRGIHVLRPESASVVAMHFGPPVDERRRVHPGKGDTGDTPATSWAKSGWIGKPLRIDAALQGLGSFNTKSRF